MSRQNEMSHSATSACVYFYQKKKKKCEKEISFIFSISECGELGKLTAVFMGENVLKKIKTWTKSIYNIV